MSIHPSDQHIPEGGVSYKDRLPPNKTAPMPNIDEHLYRQPTGKLFAQVYEKDTGKPIREAKVSVSEMIVDEQEQVSTSEMITDEQIPRQNPIATVQTNQFGETATIALPTPPKEYSLDPLGPKPYSEYILTIEAPGYVPIMLRGIQVFEETTANQKTELIPVNRTNGDQSIQIIDIPQHKLTGQYPDQQLQLHNPDRPPADNFDIEVMIPDIVIVHGGHPKVSAAPKYTVPFKDYIKNVTAHEIYATWPKETIKANVLCVISYTLNRVYKKHYSEKGFTITNSTSVDHMYVHQGTTYEEINTIVDEIFSQYLIKPGKIEPFFAQYCQGKKGPCQHGGLSQFGSAHLGVQGRNHLEILFHYYRELEIRTANYLKITKEFLGRNLQEGDHGDDVRILQTYLVQITKKHTEIPKVAVSGSFESKTASAVRSFQKKFSLPENGIVDEQTWYKLTDIYIYVINLPGVLPILNRGSHGELVKKLQTLLNKAGFYAGTMDGVFGAGTEKAVQEFQKMKGLTITGIVRKETWKSLEGLQLPGEESRILQFSDEEPRSSLPNRTNTRTLQPKYMFPNGYMRKQPYYTGELSGYYPPYYPLYGSPGTAFSSNIYSPRDPWVQNYYPYTHYYY